MLLTAYLDFWFTDRPLVERVAACAALGLRAVQVWAWRDRPMAAVAEECLRWGVTLNDTFDPRAGSLVDAADHGRCLDAWAESLDMARQYGIKHLYMFSNEIGTDSTAVRLSRDYSAGEQYANLLDGAAQVMALVDQANRQADTNIDVWFEALNTFHLRGVLVNNHALAADVVRRVNHPRLRMAFDCYHQQRTAGNLIEGVRAYAGLYDTFHIADVPTRAEPGTGEINYPNVLRALKAAGFDGSIGLEFTPSGDPALALRQMQTMLHEAGFAPN